MANRAVTGVGAPSYTSGVHIWNGAAEILNAKPASKNTMPTTKPADAPPDKARAISEKFVEPV